MATALEKAFLKVENDADIKCLFNPSTISVSASNNWKSNPMPGAPVSTLTFGGANSGALSLELTFDTTAEGTSVGTHTSRLMKLLEVDYTLPGADEASRNGRPPIVTFHWGEMVSFPAVVQSVSLNFTYFSSTGTPLRATAQLSLQQYEKSDAFVRQNPTSGTPNPHRVHRVQPGETLDRISARYYGDSTQWRRLAIENGIEDPLAVRPGTLLHVPRRTSS
jgi:LysM repeat protein